VRGEDDFARHLDYIHFSPVKHGHVERVGAWPFSSFQRMVRPVARVPFQGAAAVTLCPSIRLLNRGRPPPAIFHIGRHFIWKHREAV
jgi:hypothetical protein